MERGRESIAPVLGDLGRTDIVQHQTNTGDLPPIKQRVRRYLSARREEERKLVEDMLEIVIIQESSSAWSSPSVPVKKKDGMTRFCIDYRRLNQITKADAYPLPQIEDSLNTLGGARFFCSLDLACGYWQVKMDTADREKTAFVTQGGLYEFRVMPFGLVNAPATFESRLVRVFSLPGRHPHVRTRLHDDTGEAAAGGGPTGDGRAETQSEDGFS